MDERVKKLWVDALRSGKYIQGGHSLRQAYGDRVKDCCLGVLCNLFLQDTGKGDWLPADYDGTVRFRTASDTEQNFLPLEVQAWAGLNSENPELGDYKASEWNDGEAEVEPGRYATFTDIANMIEVYL